MSRGIFHRVFFWSILVAVALLVRVSGVTSHSCREVKTAFQLRQIGPLKLVPETPGTDAELQICQHKGPTCCTRRMEENYQVAVRRETQQSIRSLSFELKFLIVGHTSTFQETFHSLVSVMLNRTLALFDSAYAALSREARPLVTELFTDLALFIHGANVSAETAVHRFFDSLFPLAYGRLVNPGAAPPTAERAECLRATRRDVGPFGPHPQALADALALAGGPLRAARALGRALAVGAEALNATEHAALSRDCSRALVRMQFCPHCRGLTLIRPCNGFCLNVMRGCLASLAELDRPWRLYLAVLEELIESLDLEQALLGVRNRINEALLYAQLHGPRLTATVDKVCGQLSEEFPTTSTRPSPEVMTQAIPVTPSVTSPGPAPLGDANPGHLMHQKSSLPLKPSKNDKPRSLKKISGEFMRYIQRYTSFFGAMPEMLCDGELVVHDYTCWSGADVVESYSGHVVGNGLQAQKQNPEIKVRSLDPILLEVKEKLEHFNQEMQGTLPRARSKGVWAEPGSGASEGSTDCDDEDGCQGSGQDPVADREVTGVSSNGTPGRKGHVSNTFLRIPTSRTPKATGHAHASSPPLLALSLLLSTLVRQRPLLL